MLPAAGNLALIRARRWRCSHNSTEALNLVEALSYRTQSEPATGAEKASWGAEIRSCGSSALVEEPAEQVTSLCPGLATLVDEVQTNGWTWRLQPDAVGARGNA